MAAWRVLTAASTPAAAVSGAVLVRQASGVRVEAADSVRVLRPVLAAVGQGLERLVPHPVSEVVVPPRDLALRVAAVHLDARRPARSAGRAAQAVLLAAGALPAAVFPAADRQALVARAHRAVPRSAVVAVPSEEAHRVLAAGAVLSVVLPGDGDKKGSEAMEVSQYSAAEIAARGRQVYEEQLRGKLEPQFVGKFLVIDIETGEYEIDDDGEAASLRAYKKKPKGIRYGMRIGHRSWGRIGFGGAKEAVRFLAKSMLPKRQ